MSSDIEGNNGTVDMFLLLMDATSLGNKSSWPVFEFEDGPQTCAEATQSGSRFDVPSNGTSFCSYGPVLSGVLLNRSVIGAATLRRGNESYEIFLEFVQPYNFSFNEPDLISFITPRMDDAARNTNLTLQTNDGRITFLDNGLLVTDRCPGSGSGIGWLGSGLGCRRCPTGTFPLLPPQLPYLTSMRLATASNESLCPIGGY
jgi:hypothetical protein